MGIKAVQEGRKTTAMIVSNDDYQMMLAAAFNSSFSALGGISLGAMTVDPGQDSYIQEINAVKNLKADVVAIMAYPRTAAIITQEWVAAGKKGAWYLAPTLHTDMFLQNVPADALEDVNIFSPSLSQPFECEVHDEAHPEVMDCIQDNATSFSEHYAKRWRGDTPLPSSIFYYDSVVLLALGLQAAFAGSDDDLSPVNLRTYIQQSAEAPGKSVKWSDLDYALKQTARGEDVVYSGAAAEYKFNYDGSINLGETDHNVMDTWTVKRNAFVLSDSIGLRCNKDTAE
jgi:neutral amino acid transport system substrate-binding protein